MKKITYLLLTSGLLIMNSCGSDDMRTDNNVQDVKTLKSTSGQELAKVPNATYNEKVIDDMISAMEKTFISYGNKEIDNSNIDSFFNQQLADLGYPGGGSAMEDFTVSETFASYNNQIIQYQNFTDVNSYIQYLDGIKKNITIDKNLDSNEQAILLNGIVFQMKVVEMGDRIESMYLTNTTGRFKWRCIAAMVAGHTTGLVTGCGAVGGVGAAIGGAAGPVGTAVGAAVGCWAGGSLGSAAGMLTGALVTPGC
ncbi:hypothetical protein ATE47_11675 [Chryseobacterium sp. IHB B 17019]|jgi:protein involved in sex pheromone biosynthesis|uniref:hypothetical protein n=1 Tax=Chryseobacterium sp. IHB B 17019 TaxID=1721091 RepID=UPI0007215C2A|nr:hypothetical protein [Chryseobacterium sp. IHB B 17019]ALR31141.1 hypothetical protein ATE47_11675 [Chryseobacterium sp. IHB B 17019]